jgi:hypothetical protein
MLALHASSGVGPGQRRRVFSARYLGEDARHAPRPWRTSPPFPGLAERMADGAELDDPLFPSVWPAAAPPTPERATPWPEPACSP